MANIENGYAYVSPRTSETARALLDAAKAVNQEPYVVRTTIGGYIVPEAVAKKYEATLGAPKEEPVTESESVADAPTDSWTNADIRSWAEENNVPLGDATKKADMLAAIQAHKEE
jgi:hypothetical protein